MLNLNSLGFVGSGLKRPECVLCTRAGNLYASDWDGGVTMIRPDGIQKRFLTNNTDFQPQPNGIALLPDGSFLLAHLGAETGGVFRLYRDGRLEPFLVELDGEPLPPTNYVHLDAMGRVWISVSTRVCPRAKAYRPDVSDGFVVLLDENGARIVAEGLGYTNECVVDPTGEWLYVNETFARRLSRFRILAKGSLDRKEVVATFGHGVYPDGLNFDAKGGIWIVSIVSNRVIRLDHEGNQEVVLEDCEPEHVDWVENAFQNFEMSRPHLDGVKSRVLKNISSLAFGGEYLQMAYLGCLLGDRIAAFRTEYAGAPPAHWHFDD